MEFSHSPPEISEAHILQRLVVLLLLIFLTVRNLCILEASPLLCLLLMAVMQICSVPYLASGPGLSPSSYSRRSHLVGEVTAEMEPLEMPGWISPGQVGKDLDSGKAGGQRGCVWSYMALALMGCYSSLEKPRENPLGQLGLPCPVSASFPVESSLWPGGQPPSNPGPITCQLGDYLIFPSLCSFFENVIVTPSSWN